MQEITAITGIMSRDRVTEISCAGRKPPYNTIIHATRSDSPDAIQRYFFNIFFYFMNEKYVNFPIV